jgi:FlaA1/EpsC-like NDP-sugar epimerase
MSTSSSLIAHIARRRLNFPLVRVRILLIVLLQSCLILVSYYMSFLLRFDFQPAHHDYLLFLKTLPLLLIVKLFVFELFGLLRGWWRYVGMSDAIGIAQACGVSFAILFPVIEYGLRLDGYPRSVLVIDSVLTFLLVGGARMAVRTYMEAAREYVAERRTLVVGAGGGGNRVVHDLKRNPKLDLKPVGFVDDDHSKQGLRIHGIKVVGTIHELPELIKKLAVECVLIAIPSASGAKVEQIISSCRACRIEFKILPSLNQHIHGPASSSTANPRSVQLEDLLGREQVNIDTQGIRSMLGGKTLLITGAAGSIGSELARQIARFDPESLIVLDRSENDLFKLGRELSSRFPHLRFHPVIADIQDVGTMREVFALYRPRVVFHAAAYKHVPMMEQNCFQAVINNVFGTYNVALLARQFEIETFVMVSSDKAVNPTNVMGVTKRVAELITLGLRKEHTQYVAVRFGNVLGSNGSVVPIFQEQIAAGGPVTVTHPDATRYFMTIPEAVQLVLQASTMGRGSEILVLEMGQPARIVDLARNLIRFSGLEPDTDIKIVFTGLRPGEKLFEELNLQGEGMRPTSHSKIRVLDGGDISFEQVRGWLDELSLCLEAKNLSALLRTLQQIVPEYTPSAEILAVSEVDRHDMAFLHRQERSKLRLPVTGAA